MKEIGSRHRSGSGKQGGQYRVGKTWGDKGTLWGAVTWWLECQTSRYTSNSHAAILKLRQFRSRGVV